MKKTITMTKEQARRMGRPDLAGKKVQCIMPTDEQVKQGRHANVARDVFHNGVKVGGGMDVDK